MEAWLLKGAIPYSPARDNTATREYNILTPRGRGVVRWGLLAAHAFRVLDLLDLEEVSVGALALHLWGPIGLHDGHARANFKKIRLNRSFAEF